MQVRLEKNTARKFHRIELPAQARIDDKSYEVLDWSLGGFQIACEPGEIPEHWTGRVTLILPFQEVDVTFVIRVRSTWSRNGRAGFVFEELPPRIKRILKTYVEGSIEGRLGEAEGVISRIDGLELPMDVETPYTDVEKQRFKRRFYLRSLLYWLAGLALIAAIGVVFFYNLTQTTSIRAIVSMPLVNVDAPADGRLESLGVQEGQRVTKGQVLFSLENGELTRNVERQERAIATAEKERSEVEAAIASEIKAQALYRASAAQTLARLEAQRDAVRAQMTFSRAEYERAQRLFSSGSVSQSYMDERLKTYESYANEERALSEQIRMARVNKESSDQGKFMGSNGAVHGELDVLRAQLDVKDARVREAQAALRQSLGKLEETKVVSPADGETFAIKQTPGSFLRKGDKVIALRPLDWTHPWALARFTYEEAQGIAPGSRTDVFLPSIGLHVTGYVQALGRQALSNASASQDMELTLSEVPVKILLDTDNPAVRMGLAAIVTIKSSLRSKLEAKLGRLL